jgi:hypothetical protein
MTDHITVTLDEQGLAWLIAALADRPALQQINQLLQELKTMSGNLSDQEAAAAARSEAALATITTEITAIAAELKAGTGTVGTVLTQSMVDRNTAIATSLEGAATSLGALVTPTGGTTHLAQDVADLTPNGSLKADGVTVRNNFFMANFNSANPETT